MKLWIDLLLCMSASGSLGFLVYLLINHFTHENLSASVRYKALKLCMLLYLVPIPLIKHLGFSWFGNAYADRDLLSEVVHYDIGESLNLTRYGILFPRISYSEKSVLLFWGIVILVLLTLQILCFFQFKHKILNSLRPDHRYETKLASLKAEMGIKKDVRLFYCDAEISPFTCGCLHPVIITTSLVSEESSEMILRHELQHIKSRDLIYRGIGLFLVFLHCFNPLAYLMFKELKEVQELNCDETLSRDFTPEERLVYGYMVINIAAQAQEFSAPAIYFCRNRKTFLQKRVRRISTPLDVRRAAMALTVFVICAAAAFPVSAYSPRTYDWRDDASTFQEDIKESDWIEIDLTKDSINEMHPETWSEDEMHFQEVSEYFLLEDGTVLDLPNHKTGLHAVCKHTWKTGQYKQHLVQGKGCTVKIYTAKICTKCNHITNKQILANTSYASCPHK